MASPIDPVRVIVTPEAIKAQNEGQVKGLYARFDGSQWKISYDISLVRKITQFREITQSRLGGAAQAGKMGNEGYIFGDDVIKNVFLKNALEQATQKQKKSASGVDQSQLEFENDVAAEDAPELYIDRDLKHGAAAAAPVAGNEELNRAAAEPFELAKTKFSNENIPSRFPEETVNRITSRLQEGEDYTSFLYDIAILLQSYSQRRPSERRKIYDLVDVLNTRLPDNQKIKLEQP